MPAEPASQFATLDEWIAREAISFDIDSPDSFRAAVDAMMRAAGSSVELLGIGEPTHGPEEFLLLRNRMFQRLVEGHGFTAIAVESSFPSGRLVDDFVAGRISANYDDVAERGFSHGFGQSPANRELVEWKRAYNADPSHSVKLRFYGFDGPMEMMYTDSPGQLIRVALEYLASIDASEAAEWHGRIGPLLGDDSHWESPAANMDPSKSIGNSPAVADLRSVVEDLVTHLKRRRPELVAATGVDRFHEALHHAESARLLITYHMGVAGTSGNRIAELLGVRDLMMSENLMYVLERERRRKPAGRVLAFAHNSHLKRGKVEWQLGDHHLVWWPAGAQLNELIGDRYAVIGTSLGESSSLGIGPPESRTLEERLTRRGSVTQFVPTHRGTGLPAAEIAALPTRSANPSYFPFTSQSIANFDWLTVLHRVQ
jgi:erythromycin esterase